ncbi:4Fe-4S dicluster domain-containing protein [Anaerorhabdus sp.]|uniref:4Fe-4S dicluster domain-containing protein n=1 Tax=Anaerorhabdus sp. TaxID=1872524 RepID=UPI002FC7A3A0
MSLFKHDARQFKFDILREIAEEAFQDDLSEEKVQAYTKKLIPGTKADFRCCVYKEREILRQRTRLAMGKMANDAANYNPRQIVQVIEAACDGCTIKKINITDNCRKCMAKSCMGSCNFGAITMGQDRAQINYDKCKECGACARNCPYNAIVVTERPCSQHCPVDAIRWDEDNIAIIDEKKCINCGGCQAACPFGAIEDISWIVPVIQLLRLKTPTYAIIAPAIQGQFETATLPQIKKSIKMLGFDDVFEAAIGADAVAYYENQELQEHIENKIPLTTSCCPAFVNMAKIHFPEQYEKNVSTTVSPMMAMARKLKQDHPDHGIVFIGPCLAKKQEAMEEFTAVDYVLTFEELAAMFVAQHIYCEEVEPDASDYPSVFGRGFAQGGGVSKAVVQAAKEANEGEFKAIYADGCFECKKQLLMMKAGKFDADILEGMCCTGGCIAGPGTVESAMIAKGRMNKENLTHDRKKIQETLEIFDFNGVDMHRGK